MWRKLHTSMPAHMWTLPWTLPCAWQPCMPFPPGALPHRQRRVQAIVVLAQRVGLRMHSGRRKTAASAAAAAASTCHWCCGHQFLRWPPDIADARQAKPRRVAHCGVHLSPARTAAPGRWPTTSRCARRQAKLRELMRSCASLSCDGLASASLLQCCGPGNTKSRLLSFHLEFPCGAYAARKCFLCP